MDPVLKFDPWYLQPPEEAKNIQHTDYYIKHGEKKAIRRKIFENVEYDEFEKKNLLEFKEFVRQNNVQVPPGFKESSYLKMLQSGKYNMKKSLKALTSHVEWINTPKWHNLDTFSTNFLKQGNVYLCGRDKQFRPVIYMDCEHLNLKVQGAENITQAMCVFLEMIKKHMMIGGKVENWIFIIDTRGKGIFDLPLKALGVIIDVMQVNFGGHLEKMFILNPSFGLSTTWSVIEKMIDEEAASKIKFLKKNKLDLLQQDIDPKYLQKKYSGTLDDLTEFWPPIDIYTTQQQKEERKRILNPPVEVVVQPQLIQAAAVEGATIFNHVEDRKNTDVQGRQQEINLVSAQPFSFGGTAEPFRKQSNDKSIAENSAQQAQQVQQVQQVKEEEKKPLQQKENIGNSPFTNKNKGDLSNKGGEDALGMSQSFGNTAFYQLTKASSKRQVEEINNNNNKQEQNQQSKVHQGIEIKISLVENERIVYDNMNQFNKQDEPQTDNNNFQQTTATTQETRVDHNNNNTQNTMSSQVSFGKKDDQFKEIEKGFVVVQEEEEEGHTVTATDVNQLIKKSKSVFAKQTTITENKKMVEIEQIDKNQNRGGCCNSNEGCNIF